MSAPMNAFTHPAAQTEALSLVGHWVGGRALVPTGPRAPVFNPSLGCQVREVGLATVAEVDLAVRAAHEAAPAWAKLPALRRARVLFRFKALLDQNAKALARLLS